MSFRNLTAIHVHLEPLRPESWRKKLCEMWNTRRCHVPHVNCVGIYVAVVVVAVTVVVLFLSPDVFYRPLDVVPIFSSSEFSSSLFCSSLFLTYCKCGIPFEDTHKIFDTKVHASQNYGNNGLRASLLGASMAVLGYHCSVFPLTEVCQLYACHSRCFCRFFFFF